MKPGPWFIVKGLPDGSIVKAPPGTASVAYDGKTVRAWHKDGREMAVRELPDGNYEVGELPDDR